MKTRFGVGGLMILIILLAGCAPAERMEKEDAVAQKENVMMKQSDAIIEKGAYTGAVLAGTTTLYREFTQKDYEQALQEGKTVVLYFYANWCPICKREQKEAFAAFNEATYPAIVGFRVNYKDSDTDAAEEALAKEFGIAYQHTKIIMKNGERVLKAPDSWDKKRYLEELAKVA